MFVLSSQHHSDKGKFNPTIGTPCSECSPGLFQDQNTIPSPSCKACPTGYDSLLSGSSSCSDLGGVKPTDCKDDEYFNTSLLDCERCPLGSSCLGPITFSQVKAKFGWQQCTSNSKIFARCSFPGACLGGPNPALEGKVNAVSLVNDSQLSYDPALCPDCKRLGADPATCSNCTERCAVGYSNASENLRCSTCAPNFAPVAGGQCEQCAGSGGSVAFIVITVLLAILSFIVLLALKMRSSGSRKAEHSTMKRTLLTHLQMLSIVMSLTVPWPKDVRNILTFVSSITSISAQASSIQCTTDGEELTQATIFYITLTCSVLLPFLMMLLTCMYWFVCVPRCKVLSCGKKLRQSPLCPKRNPFRVRQQHQQHLQAPSSTPSIEPDNTAVTAVTPPRNSVVHSTRDGWIVTNVLLVYILMPSITKSCFQMFQLEAICDTDYWSLDDTIKFYDANHQSMIFFVAVPSLLFYGGLCPFLAMLYIGRHQDRQTNRKLMFRFGLLYSGFAPKYWYYELILSLRKIVIILIVTFASSNEQQLHIALGVLIVLLYLLEHLRPYSADDASPKDRLMQGRLHRMESLSLVILIGMVWSAVFFVLGCNDNDGTCSVLGVSVLGSNVIFALGSGYVVAQSFQKKNHLGEKLNRLASALSFRLVGGGHGLESGVSGTGSSSTSGDEVVHFETTRENGAEELNCSVKINPLARGATRVDFFRAKRKSRRQTKKSGEGTGSSIANAAVSEIEMTAVVEQMADAREEEEEEEAEQEQEEEKEQEKEKEKGRGGREREEEENQKGGTVE